MRIARYVLKICDHKRSANYGSPRVNQHVLAFTRAEVLADPCKRRLMIPTLATGTLCARTAG
jgi:hypothetical protein